MFFLIKKTDRVPKGLTVQENLTTETYPRSITALGVDWQRFSSLVLVKHGSRTCWSWSYHFAFLPGKAMPFRPRLHIKLPACCDPHHAWHCRERGTSVSPLQEATMLKPLIEEEAKPPLLHITASFHPHASPCYISIWSTCPRLFKQPLSAAASFPLVPPQ